MLMSTVEYRDYNFVRAYGSWLWLEDGRRLLDFFTDTGTAALGYNSAPADTVLRRMQREGIPVHAPNIVPFPLRTQVAERLCREAGMDRVFFCNSGAESVEAAIKLARRYQYDQPWMNYGNGGSKAKTRIYTHAGGFHGRTLATLAAGDGPRYHNEGFGPLPADFVHFREISQIHDDAAAVLLAPVNGANDVREHADGWLAELRARCDQLGALLIFDEVQTGSGRTGALTYAQRIGVAPDILCLAKGIAMGFPCGVTMARGPCADTFKPGHHFSTFGGSPAACAFIDGMLDVLSPRFLAEINHKGEMIRQWALRQKWIKETRGVGMMFAFETTMDARVFAREADAAGVLLGAWRPSPLKIAPPLNITEDDLMHGLSILSAVAERLS